MKNLLYPLLFAAALLLGCQREQNVEPADTVAITVTAGMDETRTYIEAAPAGWLPYWNNGDVLGVMVDEGYDKPFGLTNMAQDGRTGTFQGNLENIADGEHVLTAWYPKALKAGREESVMKFILAGEQTPGALSFDPTQDLLVAKPAVFTVADGTANVDNMSFKRIFTVVRVLLSDASQQLGNTRVTRVGLTAGTTLCGKANVDITTGEITRWQDGSPSVAALYEEGFLMDGTAAVWLLVNPTTLQSGSALTLDVTTEDDNLLISKTVNLRQDVVFAPNTVTTLRFTIEAENIQDKASVTSYTWDFGSAEWQAALASQASSAKDANQSNWSVTLNGLTYVSSSKNGKWSEDGYIQPNGGGSTTDRVFTFTAPAAGTLTVTAATPTKDQVRNVCVSHSGGSDQKSVPTDGSKADLVFQVGAGKVCVYPDAGIRFYKLVYTSGSGSGGEDPVDPPQPGENAELECPNPPQSGQVDPTALYGYAQAAGVTGGEMAGASPKVLHFDNGKALQTWLLARTKSEKNGDHSPVVIWLSGTFGPDCGRDFSEAHPWFDVKDVSNLSFYGTDDFVMDRIGIFCVRANNIVIRNINFQQPKANNGADAVSMQNCDGVWVDHCTFTSLNQVKDYEDGSTDVTHATKNVTVSWCHYIKTQKSCLVGHSNSASADAAITATFHHNWFDQSSSRHPRVRFGRAHVYNNLFDGCTTYGVGSAYGAKVLVEYNYFDGVQLPTDICTYPAKESNESNLQGKVAGYLYATEDILVNRPAKAKDPYPLTNVAYTEYGGAAGTPLTYSDFQPTYSYIVTPAEDVPEVVRANAGYGKLGWTEAPIAVNNGDITDFNGSDDDPTDPDTGDEDDPSQSSGPGTHTLCVQNKSVVETGGSYFTYSSSLADFSKDYSGSFTIDGVTYSHGLKFDSKGSVSFTTSSTLNATVQFYFARRKSGDSGAQIQLVPTTGTAQVFDTPYDTYGDSGVIQLEKGMGYTIKQVKSEQALILVVVTESE